MTMRSVLLSLCIAIVTAFSPLGRNLHAPNSALFAEQVSIGTANPSVDMNDYNLELDEIVEEWTANLQPTTAMAEGGAYLGALSFKDIMVDTVQVKFARRAGEGMGIVLQEIAGGREDGLGITVVSGVVEDGAAAGSGILEGDSISKIAVVQPGPDGEIRPVDAEEGVEELASVGIECLGYDATVDSIVGLPSLEEEDVSYLLTLKRLRRRPRVNLTIQYPPSQNEPDLTIQLFSGENLRRAMLTRGVKLNDPLSRRFDNGGTGDCGAEGTCATCSVSVLRGGELLNKAGIQEEQMLRVNPRWRMACRAIVGYGFQQGDLTVRVSPKQWE